jgi:hypothetical protein
VGEGAEGKSADEDESAQCVVPNGHGRTAI